MKVRRDFVYKDYIKRPLDIVLSGLLLFAIIPLFLVIALVIRIQLGRPIIFSQERIGKDQKQFFIHKFRTMTEEKDENGNYFPDEKRLTRWGKYLRSTSLDELPELINIIKGDMSIIGPRPMPTRYLPYMSGEENRRHNVRGGLIPPEIMYGDTAPTWEEQFSYEVKYSDHVTFKTDLEIFIHVFKMLLKRNKENYGEYIRPPLDKERANNVSEEVLFGG